MRLVTVSEPFSQQKEVEILEMNIQPDHVHVLAMVPPKIAISDQLTFWISARRNQIGIQL
jgi:REP element-mobilizing transposase RayT